MAFSVGQWWHPVWHGGDIQSGTVMQDVRFGMQDVRFGMQDAGCEIWDAGWIWDVRSEMQDVRFGLQDGWRMSDMGCRM